MAVLFGVYKNCNTRNKNKWQLTEAFYTLDDANKYKELLISNLKQIGYDKAEVVMQLFNVSTTKSADELPEILTKINPEPQKKHFTN